MAKKSLLMIMLLASAAVPAAASAQSTVVPEGTRVRVQAHNDWQANGYLSSAGFDKIGIIDVRGERRVIAVSDIKRFDVYAGRKARTVKGAILGAALGAVIGGVAARAAGDNCSNLPGERCNSGMTTGAGAMAGGFGGAWVGALIGLSKRDTWRTVSLPVQVATK